MSGSSRSRCASSPYVARAYDVMVCTDRPTPTLIQAAAISSSICRYTSYGWPPPPYCSGYGRPSRPAFPSVLNASRGNVAVSSAAAAYGASSCSQSSRTKASSSFASSVGSILSTLIRHPSRYASDDTTDDTEGHTSVSLYAVEP